MSEGTPKNLDEAITRALTVGPLSEIRERTYTVFKDYLAQKFGCAILLQHGDERLENILRDLFDEVVRREERR